MSRRHQLAALPDIRLSVLHLFYVYSGIVARMVPNIIRHLDLSPEDVLIVTDRSQTPASAPLGLRSENAVFRILLNRWRTLPQDWATILHNSHRIEQLTAGRKFTAYLPSPSDPPGQQILWHPLCQRYWLIEEGLGSYCPPGVSPVHLKPFTAFQKLQLGARIRGLGRISPTTTDYPYWPSKYSGAFGSNELTFPDFPEPVVNLDHPLYHAVETRITRLVVFDDFSVFNLQSQNAYLDVIRKVITAEHTAGDHWAYKLHPRCAAWPELLSATRQIFTEALPPDIPFEMLEPDASAEDIGLNPGVTTYGYMSSCLFYIHQHGGSVISIKSLIERRDPGFRNLWHRFFPAVLESLVGAYPQLQI